MSIELDAEPLMTKKQAAEFLQVTPRCVNEWMLSGVVPYYRLGKKVVRFKRSDIMAHLDAKSKVG